MRRVSKEDKKKVKVMKIRFLKALKVYGSGWLNLVSCNVKTFVCEKILGMNMQLLVHLSHKKPLMKPLMVLVLLMLLMLMALLP